MLSSLM